MLTIDGSIGEGGGQILRTAIALSALLLKPIRVINIRAKRPRPGLRPQHLMSIKAVASLCNAEVNGLTIGSREITFKPRKLVGGEFKFDIGTAGSISLVLQALLPVAAFLPEPTRFKIKGGTDVPKSPPIDYLKHVFSQILEKMGVKVDINIVRRGHYPRGGGIVEVSVDPVKFLKPLNVTERGRIIEIRGISHAVKLPAHVAERQKKSAIDFLRKKLPDTPIQVITETYDPRRDPHFGPGSGIVLWAITEKNVLGGDSLGARGKPAEVVGREAAEKLWFELSSGMAFDRHSGDMIIPYMALARGFSRIGISTSTLHLTTNIRLVEEITGVKFNMKPYGKGIQLEVNGLGYSNPAL
ncbi:MAG TPA: RNA 3'-terminal phosphate cyclase [Thermoproteales archaeon]|nr:RNA 3'-terminal phosphate cyclase [Thermoproteales archaeon]